MNKTLPTIIVSFVAASSFAFTTDFDSLANGFNANNVISGVDIVSGNLSGTMTVGSTITYNQTDAGFMVDSTSFAWSPSNIAFATGTKDLKFDLQGNMGSASLRLDKIPADSPDTVRLIAANYLSGNDYQIVDVMERTDDGVALNNTLMSVSSNSGFTHLFFEATTEQEGIDDLTFEAVPEPATLAIFALGGLAALRKKAKSLKP